MCKKCLTPSAAGSDIFYFNMNYSDYHKNRKFKA